MVFPCVYKNCVVNWVQGSRFTQLYLVFPDFTKSTLFSFSVEGVQLQLAFPLPVVNPVVHRSFTLLS